MAGRGAPAGIGRFVPAWWCRGGHAQTIWAAILPPVPLPPGSRCERWDTVDGDFLDLDHVPADAGAPILLVLHGLEGSSRTPQVRAVLSAAHRRRWRALALNFRSCSGETNRLRRSYHGGDTADLAWVIERLADRYPNDPICGVGMSLGGNVLLKYLGEPGERPSALKAAVTISAPFDLAGSARAFERGVWNRVYMRRLVRSLKRKTHAKLARYPDLLDRRRLAAVRTIRDFDEAVTAPLNGFASAQAYWTAACCRPFLAAIRRPTLLVNALDDPLVSPEVLPRDEIARNPSLTAIFPESGGHIGFVSGGLRHSGRWLDRAVFDFFASHLVEQPARAAAR